MLYNMVVLQAPAIIGSCFSIARRTSEYAVPQSTSQVDDRQAVQYHKPINIFHSDSIMKHSM
jgi:hypothetical protein